MRVLKNNKGLTLIELLISVVILGIILITFTSLYVMGLRIYQSEFRNSNLQAENRIVLDRIMKDTKQSSAIDTIYSTYTSNTTDTLILMTPSIDVNGDFLYDGQGEFITDTIVYHKTNSDLQKITDPDQNSTRVAGTKTLISNVTTFAITYTPDIATAKSVEVNLVTSDTAGKDTLTVNNRSSTVLRNK